jgi:protein-S-isoprenylcysteine O-methyltransferase Ste14
MNDLNKKALGGLLFLFVILAILLFLPAWTFHYWEAWLFLAIFITSVFAITFYLFKYDMKLLERRMDRGSGAEKLYSQKMIHALIQAVFMGTFIVSSLDHRFAWSVVPVYIIVIGEIMVAAGLFIIFLVFKENSFASATIQISVDHAIISTGPYEWVRHPMYSGAMMMFIGIPLSLDSFWGLSGSISLILIIILRLLGEEKFLLGHLPGYGLYRSKVKYRLIPYVW